MKFLLRLGLVLQLAILLETTCLLADRTYDVVVYDSSSGGVVAAVAAARHGATTLLICASWPSCFRFGGQRVGGMSSGGLGETDIGVCSDQIGGIAKEFYTRNRQHYGHNHPMKEEDDSCRLPTANCNETFNLEPHVALSIFETMLEESGVHVLYGAQVVDVSFDTTASTMEGAKTISCIVVSVEKEDADENSPDHINLATKPIPQHNNTQNMTIRGSVFIDAGYEGDLLARAGASFVTGREANSTYGESLNGRTLKNSGNQMQSVVNPYWNDGTTLPFIWNGSDVAPGEADTRVQAYNFRLCVTKNSTNRLPFPKPNNYNPKDWEILRRIHQAGYLTPNLNHAPSCNCGRIPNNKYDMNNCGGFSSDFLTGSWAYPNASYSERTMIWAAHRDYVQGLLWTLSTELDLTRGWGLCQDEFPATGGFPPALYVRAARRLRGDNVFTQNSPQRQGNLGNSSIGIGCYNFDSHNAQRIACKNKAVCYGYGPQGVDEGTPYVWDEGDVQVRPPIYQIPYYVLLPKKSELTNLLVVAAPSASHIGMSSLRMEPQFMIVGHSAGVAASIIARDGGGSAVQDLDLDELHAKLIADSQILDLPQPRGPLPVEAIQ